MARARRTLRHLDTWPGYVDALSTLLMVIIFLLVVFVLAQFFLNQVLQGKDTKLQRLESAINQLTKVLALEWSAQGVTVNAVGPTFIRTPGTAERLDDAKFSAGVIARIPAGRVGTIADVAGAVIYLASPAAALVTGTLLLVDGGWTAQ